MTASDVRLWHSRAFTDVDAMTPWLSAVGFTRHVTHKDDAGVVVHAEWLWPGGGGSMFGARRDDDARQGTGRGAA